MHSSKSASNARADREIPTLPQLPPSATLLKALWPRLQQYAITSKSDSLYGTCAAGAAGDEAKALACMDGWSARIPDYAAQVAAIRKQLWETFPNTKNGRPYSGSYWNEADFEDPHFQESHWGKEVYAKLLRLKKQFDPHGLFYGHHAVGSELWSADGNCRVSAQPEPKVVAEDNNTDYACCNLFGHSVAPFPPPGWRKRYPASAPGIPATGRNDTVPAYNVTQCIQICKELYYEPGASCRAAAFNSGQRQCYLKTAKGNPTHKPGDTSFLLSANAPEAESPPPPLASAPSPPPPRGMESRTVPQATADKHGAKCLNGAAPTVEIRLNRSSTQWVLFLEGGGWCYGATANATIASCAGRGGFAPGSDAVGESSGESSGARRETADYGGVMGSSPETNPDFYTWNAIFIHYCDGASMGSSRTDPIAVKDKKGKPAQLWMRGRNNFNAVIDDLLATQGMDKATEVILSGGSAGGLA